MCVPRYVDHPDDDGLEAYSRNQLGDPACAWVEEHLLWCEACQARLEALEEYARAMRAALKRFDAL